MSDETQDVETAATNLKAADERVTREAEKEGQDYSQSFVDAVTQWNAALMAWGAAVGLPSSGFGDKLSVLDAAKKAGLVRWGGTTE